MKNLFSFPVSEPILQIPAFAGICFFGSEKNKNRD
jgi:hypothetical protein